jgi:hypothetical protein
VGQKIEITSAVTIGDVAVYDTDRSLSGQDGERYRSAAEAETGTTIPADLSRRLFANDEAVISVYVTSNVVTVERTGGWDGDALDSTGSVITDFFLFY